MIKTIAKRILPRSLQHQLKKLYYPGRLRRFSDDEWPVLAVVRTLVREGDWVVDAGANIGYVSMLLSRLVGPKGRVFSFEPVAETFDLLRHNVDQLSLQNVELFEYGLSAAEGESVMEVPQDAAGDDNLYESRVLGSGEAVKILLHRLLFSFRKNTLRHSDWQRLGS